jgi:hypothetical protein
MTAKDEELVRRAAEEFGQAVVDGQVEPYLALLDEQIDFALASPMKGGSLSLHGHGELRSYLEEAGAQYTELVMEPVEVRELSHGRFLVLGTWHGRVQGGTRFGAPLAALIDVEADKVTRLRGFLDEQQALAAAR